MAKKTAEKKPRRRLKKTARRSLAAVLMITAVVVAAIPVPENAAAPAYEAPVVDTPDAFQYMYGKSIDDTNGKLIEEVQTYQEKFEDIETKDDKPIIYKSYTVKQKSNGAWEYDWQFEFFRANVGSGSLAAVIDKYNNTYTEKEVELNADIYYEYFQVTPADINQFFSEEGITGYTGSITPHGKTEFTISSPIDTGKDAFFLKHYFEDEFIEYRDVTYEKYKEDLKDWDITSGKEEPKEPEFKKKVSDIKLLDKKLEYFWEQVGVDLCGDYYMYELVDVIDVPATTSVENVSTYIPRTRDGKGNKDTDKNGFLIKERSRLIGIGERAFYDIRNVDTLIFPEEVKYIGTSAFEKSFIKEITFISVENISDRAFNECGELHKIDMGNQVKVIGTEAFRKNNKLTDIKFASFVQQIGPGAFSECAGLKTVDFSAISGSCSIGEYAFYNTLALEKVDFGAEVNTGSGTIDPGSTTVGITTLGTGAFAASSTLKTTGFTSFMFPTYIASSYISNTSEDKLTPKKNKNISGLGDCVLAGRGYLQNVVMPADLGNGAAARIPDYTFYNCYNLNRVIFPDFNGSSGRAWFGQWNGKEEDGYSETDPVKLFATVTNPNLLVQGPKSVTPNSNMVAFPRKSTWKSVSAYTQYVPYLYIENGKEYYEISDGTYLLCVNSDGYLTSCEFDPDADVTDWDHVLVIPATVGNTPVKGIAEGCFDDEAFNNAVWELRIEDGGAITSIDKEVFRGWESLKKVYIGNSITYIGDYAFADCKELIDVTFNSPSGSHEAFVIGKDAFKTGSTKLTFHGDIVKGYAPFEWATAEDNIIKMPEGIRVCYKSLSPTFLTVMYDENTGLVTLLDYPKLSQVSQLLNDTYETEIKDGHYDSYEQMREEKSYIEFSSGAYDPRRESFKNLWLEKGKAAYDSEFDGPWITSEFCAGADKWKKEDDGGGTENDDESGSESAAAKIADFLFEPITVYAEEDILLPYYTRHPFKVGESDTGYPALNAEELGLLNAVQNIVVPDGVDSIDVYGYIGDRTDPNNHNANNADLYLNSSLGYDIWSMYSSKAKKDENGSTITQPGLFSGYYDDGLSSNNGEKFKRGNDRILSVTMKSVKYLPDYAFDSCENLLSVDLGPACSDIGTAPFRGCYEMESVGDNDNDYYTTTNGIIYSKNADGSLTIEECLSARGRKSVVGPGGISSTSDENLKKVSKISAGAFEDCDNISVVDFGQTEYDTAGLTVIPEDCFRNCDNLQEVALPVTVNDIGRGAFIDTRNLRILTIYGNEVKISGGAFNEDDNKEIITSVRAHEDSAARRYADEYEELYKIKYDDRNPLEKQWKVSFYDANYKLIEDLKDDKGNSMDNPQYVKDGGSVKFPSKPGLDGWNFDEWIGLNGADPDHIEKDSIFYAQGHFDGGIPIDGKWTVEIFDGIDGQRIGDFNAEKDGTYRVPVGESFADQGWTVKHPIHDGFDPNGFVFSYENGTPGGAWTINTVVDGNMKVIALYKELKSTSGGSTNTPGGPTTNTSSPTTNTSSPTTNTSNNSGNTGNMSSSSTSTTNSSTSSSSTSSSSTSSSSTSTTSGAGQYTVFVENGSGSGTYAPGATVIIQAALPAAGMRFSHWTTDSNGVTLASASMSATTFTMPSNNVTVKANFVEDTGTAARTTGTGNTADRDDGKTRVDIEKPGISNRDLATATVNGSTDNFIVKITETDEATRAVAAALTNKYGTLDNILYYAMDISLYDSTGTTKISDTTGLTVDITIPIPDSLVAYGGNNKAGAVVNGDQLEGLNESFTTINGVPCIKFRATHFSPYTIYVDTGNLVEGMLDTTPKTGDPIHPKWFLSLGLACLSIILFMKKDKKVAVKAVKKA